MGEVQLASLIVALKARGAEKTQADVDKTTKATEKAGKTIEKTSKRWGIAFKAAGLVSGAFFLATLKRGPLVSMYLKNIWETMGWIADKAAMSLGLDKMFDRILGAMWNFMDVWEKEGFAAAMMGLGESLKRAVDSINWESIGEGALGVWDVLVESLSPVWDVLKPKLDEGFTMLWGWLKPKLKRHASAASLGMMQAMLDVVVKSLAEIKQRFKTKLDEVKQRINEKFLDPVRQAFNNTWDRIKEIIKTKIDEAHNAVLEKLEAMKAALRSTIAYFSNNPVVRYIRTVVSRVSSAVGGLVGRQAGGAVSAMTPYIVGERGPEVFIPPTGGSITPTHALGRGFDRPIEIRNVIELDGRVIAEKVNTIMAQNIRRLGG